MNGNNPKRLMNAVHDNGLVPPMPLVGLHNAPSPTVSPVHSVFKQSQGMRMVENLEAELDCETSPRNGKEILKRHQEVANTSIYSRNVTLRSFLKLFQAYLCYIVGPYYPASITQWLEGSSWDFSNQGH